MWNEPSNERLSRIPRLYETENSPLAQKLIHLHLFMGSCDWFVVEFDGDDLFWGYAILNGDTEMGEWGYMSFRELKKLNIDGLEVDCELEEHWSIRKAKDIQKITNL